MADSTSTHPSRHGLHTRKHPRRGHHTTKLTTATTGTSTSTLKKKIRDLSRFLSKKTTLPADVRLESERALAAFQHELKSAQSAAREQKVDEKYRMVRFFERKKATRKLAQLIRRRRDSKEVDEELEKKIHEAEVDVNYTLYFPRGEKYIALYRDAKGAPKVVERREAVRKMVEKGMENGTLGARPADADEDEDMGVEEEKQRKKEKKGKKRKAEVELEKKEEEEEEDGFFEF